MIEQVRHSIATLRSTVTACGVFIADGQVAEALDFPASRGNAPADCPACAVALAACCSRSRPHEPGYVAPDAGDHWVWADDAPTGDAGVSASTPA